MRTCLYCLRPIESTPEGWADSAATGDDAIWRLVCENSDTFTAEHTPEEL